MLPRYMPYDFFSSDLIMNVVKLVFIYGEVVLTHDSYDKSTGRTTLKARVSKMSQKVCTDHVFCLLKVKRFHDALVEEKKVVLVC